LTTTSFSKELKKLGIGDSLLSWLKSYIYDKKQFIKVNGAAEQPLTQISLGVPQGQFIH